ncbi:probable protein S-acyltransferase 16 isoform X2 [Amborella trichopoda]|uniref:probable protein S-acyltransferase 16 isoform X2 n=1 Tax=Amborella trichopoda TaxID=13333 RepID=UPI0009BF24AF|nr:probable protein S-acyltransferase 16 isoform X2 [Amborella trichopoda]|eukprot:XP_020524008.1 probable protein S-acyltransferase 16 isoform X2 [Amborella trichopoda]
MKCKFLSVPVLVVLLFIGFLYYTTVFILIEEWLGLNTSPGLLNAIIFSGFAVASIACYVLAIFKDPGHVPATYEPDIEDSTTPIQEIKRKGGDLRYCQKCSRYKPPRAHHCRVCRRCVLRMDHHCVWINNCVGHANYKVFFVFVMYAVMACIHSLIICGTILVPLSLALSILLGWHVYLISHNKTTIEYHEGVRAMWLAQKVGNIYQHPYDLGVYENLVSVLGPNIFSWVCPTSHHIGSGLRFRTSYDSNSSQAQS